MGAIHGKVGSSQEPMTQGVDCMLVGGRAQGTHRDLHANASAGLQLARVGRLCPLALVRLGGVVDGLGPPVRPIVVSWALQ